jgi:hypothetical protein
VAAFDGERVDALGDGPRALPVEPADPVPTRWTAGGAVLALGEPRTVGRVAFELSDAPWIARPSSRSRSTASPGSRSRPEASLADATLSLYLDPRRGRGEVRFAPRPARFLRLDPGLPARPGALEVGEAPPTAGGGTWP